jgi:hypothetical protein
MVQCLRCLNELKLFMDIEDGTYLIHSVWGTILGWHKDLVDVDCS